MSTFTYKVSYLNDPYQQYLASKELNNNSINNKKQYLGPESAKRSNRTTKLLLDVNEFGAFSSVDRNINSPTQAEKNLSLSEIDNASSNINKHSSFINPLKDMKFDVGGLFGDGEKSSDALFGNLLSKYNKIEKENSEKTIEEIKKDNRVSQDTIKMKHTSLLKGDTTMTSIDTVKENSSMDTIKIGKYGTIKSVKRPKRVDSFDNQLVENLNTQPTILSDSNIISEEVSEEENTGFNPDIYKEDEMVDNSFSNEWKDSWKSNNNASSVKSSQSKLSAFSSFTLKSTKKIGKVTKSLYKKLTKKQSKLPKSPFDIPDSYNEKEKAFEEMIFRDDTISLSLSNPNGTLTSTFADKTFPLPDNENDTDNDHENRATENDELESETSFISSVSSYEDEGLEARKKRHRHAINFEEALKKGNKYRTSLANL